MQIRILAVGERMPTWVEQACDDYLKRFPRDFPVRLQPVAAAGRGSKHEPGRTLRQEGNAMRKQLQAGQRVVALDLRGEDWSTEELAAKVETWRMDGRDVALLVGGPDGLDDSCLRLADARWSLSRLTLPHALVRIVLLEQLYRAWSILRGHPYHR